MALCRVACAALLLVGALSLRTAPTAEDEAALHKKLSGLATALEGMLSQKGSLSKTKVGPSLQAFTKELRATLNETASPKDVPAAFEKLKKAEATVGMLIKDLTSQQETLMKEREGTLDARLLGELMVKKDKPMAEQLAVLTGSDFKDYDVAKAIAEHHSDATPLFKQVGEYLDQHGRHQNLSAAELKIEKKQEEIKEHMLSTAAIFQKKVDSLAHTLKEQDDRHAKVMHTLEAEEKKATSSEAKHKVKLLMKRQERQFKKSTAFARHDLEGMKAAVAALKKGDMQALEKAQAALQESLKSMKAKTGNFLHFIQLGHRTLRRDCPFCAAQCVDKCHQEGKSYSSCLAVCADAGKGL